MKASPALTNMQTTRENVIDILKTIIDPELFIDIWTLGLIYKVELKDNGEIYIQMTFTSVACPMIPFITEEIRRKTTALPGITNTVIDVVFDPPWAPSEELKGLMGLL